MANSIITAAGLALFARALNEGLTVPIDRMIFADIPGLNADAEPDPAQGLPKEEAIVFNAEIQTSGKIDEQTVVYSRVLSATDGDFFINWIGLYSTEYDTLIAVCQVPRHRKNKTDGFQAGNTLYKNFALQFANAAQLTGITISPETWQYNFDNRYALLSHNHAIAEVTDLQDTLNGKAPTSHNHEISQVNGLQTALNGKAAASHTHAVSDVKELQSTIDSVVNTSLTAHNVSREVHPNGFNSLNVTNGVGCTLLTAKGIDLKNTGGTPYLNFFRGTNATSHIYNTADGQLEINSMLVKNGEITVPNGIITNAQGSFMQARFGSYNTILRNDGNSFYILISDKDNMTGAWRPGCFPLLIDFATGRCSINGRAVQDGDGNNIAATYQKALAVSSGAEWDGGYLTLPAPGGNILIQWGTFGGSNTTVTFPVAFTSKLFSLQCQELGNGDAATTKIATNITLTGFKFRSSSTSQNYLAIGR